MASATRMLKMSAFLLAATALLASGFGVHFQYDDGSEVSARTLQEEHNGTISVTVTDDVGRLIADAVVSLVGAERTNRTDLNGVAVFDHLLADVNGTEYLVSASKTGYNPSGLTAVIVTPGNVSEVTLEIFGGLILGEVRDQVGAIQGAMVTIPTLGYSDLTASDGSYRIYGVPGNANPYAVTATAAGYVNQTKEVVLNTGSVEVVDFTMVSLTGAISGTVKDAGTDEVLYNASVSVRVGSVTVTVSSDTNGEYRIPDLPSGTYTITATLEGFEPASVSDVVVVSGSETMDVDLLLVEGPTRLYGIVLAGSLLLPGVFIEVIGTDLSANTSVQGRYEIANITAGTYNIRASLEGYITTTVVGVVIKKGSSTELNILMQGLPGSLFGLVLDSKSRAVLPGVEITIMNTGTMRTTISNINGEFEFTGLDSGNYTVMFVADGYTPKEIGPVVITQESTARLEQVLLEPLRESFGGFIFGFDLAHSMMIIALFLTIIILALAVMLRVRTFEAPDKAPAVFDQEDLEGTEREAAEERAEPEEPDTREKDLRTKKKMRKRK